ncbi:TM2 domain-containing protein CG10795-like [Pollicipes pollicipes]|uniref:TM2 domain-containing protein CG10795-like n=1 Tax=Pollicipes pollicipes TaxID=41117 RepID=UPI0018857B9F|nr:TM2 domain-containing protein CG10795-like [Pollicipes pollicipes]XP_037069840.1 TM2 domain-containing protein CG10795-like [Pollicipes pollicipes]
MRSVMNLRWVPAMIAICAIVHHVGAVYETECAATLQMGQYLCLDLNIDPKTQQPAGCTPEGKALVNCTVANGIICKESGNNTFEKHIPCKYTNGYSFETSLLLSVFLGMLGADRFYLGYPGLGLFKFCTLGFMFVGQLVDIILIATQVVKPADGSDYVISYYGAGLDIRSMDNMTYRVTQPDW